MHWIGRLGLGPDDAADVAQDVLMTLMVRLPTFQHGAGRSFRGWLRTVTLNKTRDFLRKKNTRLHHETQAALENEEAAGSVFSEIEFRAAVARRALMLIKPEFEECTWRACWESAVTRRPAKQIAEELGISVNAVYLAKGRVLKRLRRELEGML